MREDSARLNLCVEEKTRNLQFQYTFRIVLASLRAIYSRSSSPLSQAYKYACFVHKKIITLKKSDYFFVHERGLEPPSPCGRYHLKVVRLPISPLVHI